MSSILTTKAIALLKRGGVTKLDEPGRFSVQGSEAYTVQLGQTVYAPDTCTCPAGAFGRACSHVKACKLWLSRHRADA